MQHFAVIVLILVLIVVTHVHNWLARKIENGSTTPAEDGTAHFFLFVGYILIAFFSLKYIIIWGYPLITK